MRICVADMPIDAEMTDKAFFDRRFAAYAANEDKPPQMVMTSKIVTEITLPAAEEVWSCHSLHMLRLPDGRFCAYTRVGEDGHIRHLTTYAPAAARADILLSPTGGKLSPTDYEYAYSGQEFAFRLGYLGGAVLHGSAIAYRGKGVIFSAPSGTGKSTHTALWHRQFGADVQHINDDKPALRFSDDGVTVYGTPWSGKTDLNNNIAAPLHAIVFLERGADNHIERMAPVEALFRMGREIVRPYGDMELENRLADFMATLVQRVPVYRLACNMDPSAAVVSRDGIFSEMK